MHEVTFQLAKSFIFSQYFLVSCCAVLIIMTFTYWPKYKQELRYTDIKRKVYPHNCPCHWLHTCLERISHQFQFLSDTKGVKVFPFFSVVPQSWNLINKIPHSVACTGERQKGLWKKKHWRISWEYWDKMSWMWNERQLCAAFIAYFPAIQIPLLLQLHVDA